MAPTTVSIQTIISLTAGKLLDSLRILEELATNNLGQSQIAEQLQDIHSQVSKSFLAVLARGDAKLKLVESDNTTDRELGLRALWYTHICQAQSAISVIENLNNLAPDIISYDPVSLRQLRAQLGYLERDKSVNIGVNKPKGCIEGLYVIVDPELSKGRTVTEVTKEALRGGARIIQLRDKVHDKGQQLPVAQELQLLCDEAGAIFIVNDHVDLAFAVGADGLHVGQKDLPVTVARQMLSKTAIIGCSTNNVAEALKAQEDGANYVAVGAIYPTTSKGNTRGSGLEPLRLVKQAVTVPVVAIGGINESNVAEVMAAGADSVSVISAVCSADDVRQAAQRLTDIIESALAKRTS